MTTPVNCITLEAAYLELYTPIDASIRVTTIGLIPFGLKEEKVSLVGRTNGHIRPKCYKQHLLVQNATKAIEVIKVLSFLQGVVFVSHVLTVIL